MPSRAGEVGAKSQSKECVINLFYVVVVSLVVKSQLIKLGICEVVCWEGCKKRKGRCAWECVSGMVVVALALSLPSKF